MFTFTQVKYAALIRKDNTNNIFIWWQNIIYILASDHNHWAPTQRWSDWYYQSRYILYKYHMNSVYNFGGDWIFRMLLSLGHLNAIIPSSQLQHYVFCHDFGAPYPYPYTYNCVGVFSYIFKQFTWPSFSSLFRSLFRYNNTTCNFHSISNITYCPCWCVQIVNLAGVTVHWTYFIGDISTMCSNYIQ